MLFNIISPTDYFTEIHIEGVTIAEMQHKTQQKRKGFYHRMVKVANICNSN